MNESIVRFFKSFDFYKSFVLTSSILISLGISWQLERPDIGMGLIIGMFVCAPADIPGSRRHRIIGLLAANLLAVITTLCLNLSFVNQWLLTVTLVLLVFHISIISVYGFRASLVSLAGLLAIVLSFAHPQTDTDIFIHAGMIGLGGLWYLLFSELSHLVTYKNHTAQLMAECTSLTAQYLNIKRNITFGDEDPKELHHQLFELQTLLNEKHEVLREILLTSRRNFGHSNFSRRQMLIFIELIDILELAIANLANSSNTNKIFQKDTSGLQTFANLASEIAAQLDYLSKVIGDKKPLKKSSSLYVLLEQARKSITTFRNKDNSEETRVAVLFLQNHYDYFYRIVQKIDVIENVLQNLYSKDQVWLRGKYSSKFITQQDYDWKTLTENLNFKSPIFKHSLRLTITVLVGFAVGATFPFQNSYWILLTIIVIMRPGYSLTKQRSKHRIYGTLIGAAIAVVVVFITQNAYVYGVLATITFLLAFALVQKNYKSSAIFITLSIVFIYAIIKPDVLNVIQFRVLDTLTGAALAIIANIFLWPSWESLSINEFIRETIEANKLYLKEIDAYYHHKNNTDPQYKLSRKRAFLAIGNLNAAFQRMAQEPKSKQHNLAKVYEIVSLNHTFLSLAAALGTFMRNHKTTEASLHFETYIAGICSNMEIAMSDVDRQDPAETGDDIELMEAQKYMEDKYLQLLEEIAPVNSENKTELDINPEIQEVNFISEQLKWLYSISENIKKVTGKGSTAG